MSLEEHLLPAGEMTPGIVRIGDTVRRPIKDGAPYRHQVLQLLERRGCRCAPRFLGIDAQGREILSFVDGEVIRYGPDYSDDALTTVGGMLRDLHDASAGSDLAGDQEVVIHNDIAPWNTVSTETGPVGFIDFDGAEPGSRLSDIGYMVWTFLDIGSDDLIERFQLRLGLMLDGYGLESRRGLSDAILYQQHRVLAWRAHLAESAAEESIRLKSVERVELIRNQIRWVEEHAAMLDRG
jgi:tRNA A-37 threonylcarbamoyl transferase component Bud32